MEDVKLAGRFSVHISSAHTTDTNCVSAFSADEQKDNNIKRRKW
jgi:hypothetical protein